MFLANPELESYNEYCAHKQSAPRSEGQDEFLSVLMERITALQDEINRISAKKPKLFGTNIDLPFRETLSIELSELTRKQNCLSQEYRFYRSLTF